MRKDIRALAFFVLCVPFMFIQSANADTESCGTDTGLCQSVRICEFYNIMFQNDQARFEATVSTSSNDIVRIYCKWQIGIQLLDGTIITTNYKIL